MEKASYKLIVHAQPRLYAERVILNGRGIGESKYETQLLSGD